ncbi:MAG: type II toxin-antitoxin system RelE/ParE family toxin [Caulobacterales bacterium]
MRKSQHRSEARADIRNLLKTSHRMFGPRARRDYKALLDRAITFLCADPQRTGVQRYDEVPNTNFYHLRHARTRGGQPKQPRHIIVFTYDDETLTILRVLHDAMDVAERTDDESDA